MLRLWASIGEGLPMSRQRPEWVPRTRSHTGHTSGSCQGFRAPGTQAAARVFLVHALCRGWARQLSAETGVGREEEERGREEREEKGGGELQVPNCSKR